MNNKQHFDYLNMIDSYDNINLEDLEENNISVQSIPIDPNNQNLIQNFNSNNDDNINNENFDNNVINIKEGPIKLIEFEKNIFKLNQNALNILHSIKEEIIVVSIVGKSRTGKSYLMNLLLNTNNINNNLNEGFEVASSIKSCTRGIWIWNTPRQKPNSSAKIIFIDSEGTNSIDFSTKTYDRKIFTLIILLSSLFIYNTNSNIDEQSISELALSTYLSNSIAFNIKSDNDKDNIIRELAPKFIWTLRDFTLDKIDPETGEEITSDEYLELCLRNKSCGKNSNQNNIIRENIIKYFKERECITLPRPVDKEKDLQNLKNIPFSELKPNFRSEFLNLKKKIYETSKPKIFNGKKITGPILADLLNIFINSINSGNIPNINTAWDNIILDEIQNAYDNCKNNWKYNIENNYNNIDIKFLYDLKYIIISKFNNVIENNGEIKYNKNYYDKYKDYKNKLDKEIQKEINRIILNLNKQNFTSFKNIINNNSQFLDYNISNKKYDKNENQLNNCYDDLIDDYKNILKNININHINNQDAYINLLYQSDLNITKNLISYINSNIQRKINKKLFDIEKEIKINEIQIFSDENAFRLNKINKDLDEKYIYLKNDLDNKNKEVMQLIGKYTKLIEKRDELIKDKKNSNFSNHNRNSGTIRNSKLKTSLNQIYYDVDTEACGCQLRDDICYIF